MDYAGGGNLRDKLKRDGSLPLDNSIRYIKSLAGAISKAHQDGLLHYDIKPENILCDENGNIKLAAFGLARKMKQIGAKMSRVVGTVEYMGPEQLNGEEDPRSEIWSLGAVFYEMLTGKVCFEAESDSKVILKIDSGEFKWPRKLNPSIPKSFEKVLLKMLERDNKKRYQSMDSIVEALKLNAFMMIRTATTGRPRRITMLVFLLVAMLSFGGGMFYAHKREMPFFYQYSKIQQVTIPDEILRLDYENQFDRGFEAIESRKHPLAYQIFDHVEKESKDPLVVEKAAFFKASLALNYLRDVNLAVMDFESFLEKYPDSANAGHAHYFLGQIYYEHKNDLYQARKHFTTLIERFPQNDKVEVGKQRLQDVAMKLSKKGIKLQDWLRSIFNGLRPNNLLALFISILGLVPLIATPLAWITTQYLAPDLTNAHSVRSNFKEMLKHPGVRKLIIIVVLCQVLSFVLNLYQSGQ